MEKVERKLNLNIAEKVAEFEILLRRVLPKNIWYRVIWSKGFEFDGYKNYSPEDDSSLIDWKASVRAQELLVRKYVEERDLKFMVVIDISENMVFGSTEKLKCEYAAELAAALSHLILLSGDRLGFVLFNDKIVKFVSPQAGSNQFDILVDELSNPLIYGKSSNMKKVMDALLKILDREVSLVFLISDFLKVDESYGEIFEDFSSLFETVAIIIRDPLDLTLPEINKEIVIEDPETGEKLWINPKIAKRSYEINAAKQLNLVKEIFKESNIDFVEILTSESFSEKLALFLKRRVERGRIPRKNVY